MSEVIQFHNLAHIFISLIGAILLLVIYYNIRKRFRSQLEEEASQKRVDQGLLYLSLAMFVWVVSGIWAYVGNSQGFADQFTYRIGVNLFSILNNLFLLLAIFYFYDAPSFIYKNSRNVKLIFGIILLVTLVTLGISYSGINSVMHDINFIAIPDLILSGFLSYLLGISLYRTFYHRDLTVVALVSIVVVTLIFISQLPEVFLSLDNGFTNLLIKIIAKSSLISLFLVLATSWVIQLANTPRVNEMQIKFIDWSLIQLNIPSKAINAQLIDFGSKSTQYKNLLKFAIRRKYGIGETLSILVGSAGEIKNQSYLSRIIDNINKDANIAADQKLERKDLFTFLGEGKYRLRMLPQHIEIESNLLEEFAAHKENKAYSDLL